MQAPFPTGGGSRRRSLVPASIVLDTKTGEVRTNRVFVRQTATRYLCVGIGAGSRLLRSAFEQRDTLMRFDRQIAARKIGLRSPLPGFNDPHLSRLALLAALKKDYHEEEPRDGHGRWTDGAAGAGGAGLLAPARNSTSFLGPLARATLVALDAVADSALAAAAATATGAAIFFGIVFLPANRNTTTQGTLPERPDISYAFEEQSNDLTIWQRTDGGQKIIFAGPPDEDGVFRDDNGNAVARRLNNSVLVDPDALPGDRPPKEKDEPKLCPAPTRENIEGRKKPSLDYQKQITGLEAGLDVKLPDPVEGGLVSFDGCRESDGTMLEAKGPGYAEHLEGGYQAVWDGFEKKLNRQAELQWRSAGAAGRKVEWHFAEKEVADYFRPIWANKYPNIIVIYTPPEAEQ
jgi:restriction endonuclease fold toxin 5 of polymorphic toxin system